MVGEAFRGRRVGPLRRELRHRTLRRPGLEAPTDLTAEQIEVGGHRREYWCAVEPDGDSDVAPLLVVLHGAGGQGPGMAALTGLHRRGPATGFVTVFPDGIGRVWNDSRTGSALRRRHDVDDVGFLQALVGRFSTAGRARRDAVYLAGISNGGLMAEHIARHGLLPVAGIGLVAGPGTQSSRAARPHPVRPASVVVFAGTADPLIPYAGGPIGPLGRLVQRRDRANSGRGLAVGAEAIAADWAVTDQLDTTPRVEHVTTAAHELPVTRLRWQAPGKPTVSLYRVEGGGHTWPGGPQYLPERFVGPTARSLSATDIILQHFRAHETLRPKDDH